LQTPVDEGDVIFWSWKDQELKLLKAEAGELSYFPFTEPLNSDKNISQNKLCQKLTPQCDVCQPLLWIWRYS